MVGVRDIAKAAGVSASTVSNALNGKKNISVQTRDKIFSLCEELGYKIERKPLKSIITNTILFNFSDFDRSFYLDIINGINDYVGDNNFDLMMCTHTSCEKYIKSNLTKGCIVLDQHIKDSMLTKFAKKEYPIIVLDRYLPNDFIKSIVVNNYEAMSKLVQGVIDRGYRTFGFVGGLEHTSDNKERYSAFTNVLEQNNIHFSRKNYFSGDYSEKSGYKAAKIFMLSEELPEVLICANDHMAVGAIKAFREENIDVPEGIAITGFDNCELAKAYDLTTVAVPNYEIGYLAAKYLIENINDQRNVEPFKIMAKVKWRGTVSRS